MSDDNDAGTVVLVHGWAGSAQSWAPVVRSLADRNPGRSVLPVALPGSPGARNGFDRTIAGAVATVVDAVRGLDRAVVLVGHSMGAQVTLLAAARLGDAVLGEVVVDPAYGAAESSRAGMSEWASEIESDGHAAVRTFFESALGQNLAQVDADRILADLSATEPADIASYLRSEYLEPGSIGLDPDTRLAAAHRTRPVLAIHSSAAAADYEEGLPAPAGSRVERWPGHGHFLHLEDPYRFAESIRSVTASWASP